jgi:hypothetical protein
VADGVRRRAPGPQFLSVRPAAARNALRNRPPGCP